MLQMLKVFQIFFSLKFGDYREHIDMSGTALHMNFCHFEP